MGLKNDPAKLFYTIEILADHPTCVVAFCSEALSGLNGWMCLGESMREERDANQSVPFPPPSTAGDFCYQFIPIERREGRQLNLSPFLLHPL